MRWTIALSGHVAVLALFPFVSSCAGGGTRSDDCGEGVMTDWFTDFDHDGLTASGAVRACADPDGDGTAYLADPSAVTDCDSDASSCADDCTTDLDDDGVPDCRDLCIDADLDAFGTDNSASVVGGGAIAVGACTTDGETPCSGDAEACLGVDCNDAAAAVHPTVADVPGNDVDENCSGFVACYEDGDSDGYGGSWSGESNFAASHGTALIPGACGSSIGDLWDDTGDDCNDANASVNPGVAGTCP